MSIGVITAYSYTFPVSVQYEYLGTSVSDTDLDYLFNKYGVYPTGDAVVDLNALYSAMYADAQKRITEAQSPINTSPQNAQAASSNNSINVAWATLMSQIGLRASGDLTTDYNSFSDKISLMKVSATTTQDKASIALLEAQASVVFVQQEQSAKESLLTQTPKQKPQVSGVDILAELNKLFVVV